MSNVPIILRGKIVKGQKYYFNERLAQIQYAKLEGKEFEEVLTAKKEEISTDQYGFYFGGIIKGTCMAAEAFAGWSEKEIDLFFCNEFLSFNKVILLGEEAKQVTIVQHKDKLSKAEFSEFIEKVIRWLAINLQIQVQPPEDYKLGKYKTTQQ